MVKRSIFWNLEGGGYEGDYFTVEISQDAGGDGIGITLIVFGDTRASAVANSGWVYTCADPGCVFDYGQIAVGGGYNASGTTYSRNGCGSTPWGRPIGSVQVRWEIYRNNSLCTQTAWQANTAISDGKTYAFTWASAPCTGGAIFHMKNFSRVHNGSAWTPSVPGGVVRIPDTGYISW